MRNKLLQIKSKINNNKKRAVAWLLVGSLVLGITPISFIQSLAANGDDNKQGTFLTESNTGENGGDMNLVPYNNPDLTVDLSSGSFATILVADANDDGYLDLMMGNGSTPYEGTKIFYGRENSQNASNKAEYLVMDICRRLRKNTQINGTAIYNPDGEYDKTLVMDVVWGQGDAKEYQNGGATPRFNYEMPVWNKDAATKNSYVSQVVYEGSDCDKWTDLDDSQYSYVDYDGDGCLDLIWSAGSWDDFGWSFGTPSAYNKEGVWDIDGDGQEDVLHGWVFWHENPRDAADYEGQDISETVAIKDGAAPNWGAPQVIKVYDYEIDEEGNKILDENSAKPLDVWAAPQAQIRDWDNDGDIDIICGSFINRITYFENVAGAGKMPKFVKGRNLVDRDGNEIFAEHMNLCLASAKWNNEDEFFDLLVMEEDARVFLLQNTGEVDANNTPIMKKAQYFQQPADNVKIGMMSTPVSVDWDGDGDEDIISGDSAGFISFVKNLSKEEGRPLTDPSWDKPVRLTNPDGEVYHYIAGYTGSIQGPAEQYFGYTKLSVADWDGDGVLDIMSNNVNGVVYWHRGIAGEHYMVEDARHVEVEWDGEPKHPAWYNYDWRKDLDSELLTQWRTTPFMYDLNDDDLMDLVMLDHEGYLAFFERYQAPDGTLKLKEGQRIFKDKNNKSLKMSEGIDGVSGRRLFTLADYDDDGDLDLIADDKITRISIEFHENIATKAGEFKFKDPVVLHSRHVFEHTPGVTTCDWNEDGVPDLLVGAEDGHIYYLKNNRAEQNTEPENPDEEEGINLDEHLVAHWDFEGEGDNVYKDKATAGDSDDNLTVVQAPQGATAWAIPTIENGIASFELNGGAFQADDSSDLDLTGEMTIFMKIMVRGSTGYELLNKSSGSAPGYCFYAGNPTTFSVGVGNNNSYTWTGDQIDKGADLWREVAFVVGRDQDSGNLTVQGFMSKDVVTGSADDFKALGDKVVLEYSELSTNDLPLTIGTSNSLAWGANVWRYFDDIRIYDTALSTDQLATLLPGPSIDEHLVAHWDFEGDETTALTDKATVGTANNLTNGDAENPVSIQNGVATIQPGGYLTTPDQADLDQGQEMTIFMRIKPQSGNINFMDKASGAHYAIKLDTWQGRLAYDVSDGTNYVSLLSDANILKSNAWCEVAVVVSKSEAGYLTYEIFMSKDSSTGDGDDFESVAKQTATYTKEQLNNSPLIIGNDFNKTFSTATCGYDDVRIYNTALTTDELATLIPDYKNMPGLMAHWDFEGDAETARQDKAVNSTEADNLEIGGTDGNVVVKDGIATFSGDGYMQAANSSDLSLGGEMTLFVRAKVSRKSLSAPSASFIDKRSGSLYAYAFNVWAYDSDKYYFNTQLGINSKLTLEEYNFIGEDEWREFALVVSKNERGQLNYELLMSKNEVTRDGDDFVSLAKEITPYDSHGVNNAPLIIGNSFEKINSSLVRTIDDIRIYNGALTADEIAGFITAAEGDDTSYYLKSLDNDVDILFNANQFTYQAETTNATASITPVADDANVTIKIDNQVVTSGTQKTYDLALGLNTYTITVGNGTTAYNTYTVNITRNEAPTMSVDELQAKIDEAAAITKGEYSDSSFAELQTVIATTQAVAEDAEATDAERIEAAESLQRAIAGLTSEMRYADLKELVTVAGNLQNTGYQKWADYKKWSEKAQAIVSTKSPYLGEVAEVYAGLKNAYNQLMSEESLPAVSLEGFRNVTTWNYVKSGSQMPDSGEYTNYTLYNLTDIEGNQINSLDKVLLSMKVKFAAAGGSSQLCFAYDGEKSKEFTLYPAHDGLLAFVNNSRDIWEGLWAEYTSVPHMVNQEFNLQISYEYLDTDGDKTDDALRIGFYLNGKLYEDRHFVVENCDVSQIGTSLGAVYSNDAVTISSLVVAEEDQWNLDNGEYQLGDGDVWVDNQTPSGTTLNTVGDYQVAKIAQNNVVNYAILYKTGDANADNTNDVKDLVASLKARAGEKADTRAAVLGADVNGDEIIDEKDIAGIRGILLK